MLFVPLGAVVEAHKAWAASDLARVPLGMPGVIDDRTGGGPALGEMVLFVACSGVGKTIVACNVAVHAMLRRIPTVFFSLEMDAGKIAQRIVAVKDDVPTRDIEADLRNDIDTRLDELAIKFGRTLAVIDHTGMRLADMSIVLDEATEIWGQRPRLVIIDYLELISGQMSMSMGEGIDKLSKKLKDWTRREQVVTLCLHQLNLGGPKHEPKGDKPVTKRDIRFGVDVAADYVLAGYRPGLFNTTHATEYRVQLLKTRTDGGLNFDGVEYRLNPHSLKLYDLQSDPLPQQMIGML